MWFSRFNGILSQVCSYLLKNCNTSHCSSENNAFIWTPTTDQSFHALKEAMFMTYVLTLLDFNKTFVLECDAFEKGIREVLMQDGRPLAFTNKQLLEIHLGQ